MLHNVLGGGQCVETGGEEKLVRNPEREIVGEERTNHLVSASSRPSCFG